jgi:hypothetical protein
MHVRLTRYSDDILAHKILGLGIFGLGTSDIEGKIAIFGGGQRAVPHRARLGRREEPPRDSSDDGTEGHRRHVIFSYSTMRSGLRTVPLSRYSRTAAASTGPNRKPWR